MVRAEADGVAEVVYGEARHDRVEVDHADALAGGAVDEDVVELGVVVRDAQGQAALAQRGERHGAVGLALGYELELRPDLLHPAHGVGGDGGLELGEPVLGVVELGDGIIERVRRIVAEHALELAEGPCGRRKELRGLRLLEADRALYKGVDAPGAALGVGVEVLAVPGGPDAHGLALRVAARLADHAAEVGGDADDVGHDLLRVFEGGGAYPLEDEAAAGVLARLGVHYRRCR